MTTSQRGSVLLTVIAGLVLLALLGSAMLTLMTGSVMTGVDGREAMQAAYLAESGKEIVRVQTEKLSGEDIMNKAIALEKKGPISIDGKGDVKLQFFPSWFRWTGEELKSTDSGWYGGTPKGTHDWLETSKDGATRYRIDNVNAVKNDTFGSEAADLYLIGRVSGENGITYDAANSTLTVKTTENDLEWFPNSGGLIGLVSQAGKDTALPAAAQVSTHRFTYDQKTSDKGTYTFTNVTRLSSSPLSTDTFKDKDIALGQYFRVLSTGRTLNDAQAALVWHTNGRGSLRSSEKGESGDTTVTPNASGTLSPTGNNPSQELHKEMQDMFGNNITQHNQGQNTGYEAQSLASGYALTTHALQPSVKNHFLLEEKKNAATTDYWFAAITKAKTAFSENNGGAVQISVFPSVGTQSLFAGTLFRLTTLKKDSPGTDSNAYRLGDGVAGLGMGIAYGELTISYVGRKVTQSPVNPALLPGFTWKNDGFYPNDDFQSYVSLGLYQRVINIDFAESYTVRPLMLLWAYDDSKVNPPESLRWLAVSRLKDKDVYYYGTSGLPWSRSFFSRIVTQVQEKSGLNEIRGWIASQYPPIYGVEQTGYPDPETGSWLYEFDSNHENELGYLYDWIRKGFKPSEGIVWPDMNPTDKVKNSRDAFTILQWDAVNTDYASLKEKDSVQGTSGHFTVLTPFATGTDRFERTGFFQGAYSATESGQVNVYRPSFRNFAAGEIKMADGGNDDASGLTPGIVQ